VVGGVVPIAGIAVALLTTATLKDVAPESNTNVILVVPAAVPAATTGAVPNVGAAITAFVMVYSLNATTFPALTS